MVPYIRIKAASLAMTIVLLGVFLFSGCAFKGGYEFIHSDASSVGIGADDPVVSDINSLGLELMRLMSREDGNRNLMISPVSLGIALSVLNNGAEGATREQAEKLINSRGVALEDLNSRYRDLISGFYSRKDIDICLASSLWVNREYPVREGFIETAKTWYDADVFSLDPKSPSAAKQINGWISKRTKGLITNAVGDLHPDTVVFLVSSLYFKGAWVNPFDEKLTRQESFMLDSGERITVDMMNGQFTVPYYASRDLKAIKLNYKGGASMVFIRPESDVDDLVERLTFDVLTEITGGMSPFRTYLKIPRLDFRSRDEMNGYFMNLGMTDAFDDRLADFSRMTESADVVISRIIHECRIELDESGTEAAAVTGVEVVPTSMAEPPQPMDFYLDKPFVFALMDDQTGAVLFLGKVENPGLE